ncbi:MAG TPA: hypothetical protein ENG38_00880, partial [Thermoplasmatales archaeon]|nr:hypothetical protein [Thermoplasmatales archaeon]HEX08346.1 hypothetical protein [Thermoplasmatales archaeon]
MIILVGTGHIFDLSSAISNLLYEKMPDVICLELDERRFQALKERRESGTREVDTSLPIIYKFLANFQEKLAEKYGTMVGNEMIAAEEFASINNVDIELIDVDAQELLLRMWKEMRLIEKVRLFISSFSSLFVSKKSIEKELEKLQDNYYEYIEGIGKRFPTIRKVLIDDRNEYMAKRLIELNKKHEKIVAIVGDGHIE